jgi:hypothetical protein
MQDISGKRFPFSKGLNTKLVKDILDIAKALQGNQLLHFLYDPSFSELIDHILMKLGLEHGSLCRTRWCFHVHDTSSNARFFRHNVRSRLVPNCMADISHLPCTRYHVSQLSSWHLFSQQTHSRCGFVMIVPSHAWGQISNVFAWLGTLTFFVILISLPIKTPEHSTARQIFTKVYNQTAWSSKGLVFPMTFLTPSWCISGYDSTGMSATLKTYCTFF